MRRTVQYILAGLGLVLLVSIGVLMYVASRFDGVARDYAQRALEQKFRSSVELGSVDVSLITGIHVRAKNLRLHHQGRTDVPPLIEISEARATISYLSLLWKPKQISLVELHGLRINIPPKQGNQPRFSGFSGSGKKPPPDFVINRVIADGTKLRIIPSDPQKDPLEWDIRKLRLHSAGPKEAMKFEAILTNAKPPGDIDSSGRFGPWIGDDPGQTPITGDYTFRNADLSVFRGIGGILSSDGRYHGVLERIEATGTTTTPDFRLSEAGNRLPLRTEFHAIIDGTSGDTLLQPVKAMLASTPIICSGGVTRKPGTKGRTIDLDTSVPGGRIEDILRLAVKGKKPPLTGAIRFKAKLVIPPGDVDVVRKLRLNGRFNMERVHFTSRQLQDKLDSLSNRARGRPNADDDNVTSRFDGNFVVGNGTIALDRLLFAMPGAEVLLAGNYGMRSEQLDFAGELQLDARLSQLVTGVKSWLLKPVDPFFAKKGKGTVLPIRIGGTRDHPDFGLNFRGKKNEADRARSR